MCVCVCLGEQCSWPTPQTAASGLFVLEEDSVSLSEGIISDSADSVHSSQPVRGAHLISCIDDSTAACCCNKMYIYHDTRGPKTAQVATRFKWNKKKQPHCCVCDRKEMFPFLFSLLFSQRKKLCNFTFDGQKPTVCKIKKSSYSLVNTITRDVILWLRCYHDRHH